MSYFGAAYLWIITLPTKPEFIEKIIPEISEKEFKLHKKILLDIYYNSAKNKKKNHFYDKFLVLDTL